MTPDQKRARRQASREIANAKRRYEQAPPGYRTARLRTLRRTMTQALEQLPKKAA